MDYYVEIGGNNWASGLSIGTAWRNIEYACGNVPAGAHTIHVGAGNFIESDQCVLAEGVSIEGTGDTTIISCSNGTYTFYLGSSTTAMHIRNIKMDGLGNGTTDHPQARAAIYCDESGNVEIDNCTFSNFYLFAVHFINYSNLGVTYSVGNKFHDNIVTNCSLMDLNDEGSGALRIDGQQTMLIYNNTMSQATRTIHLNGYLIKGVEGYNKDVKIYNNTLNKAPYTYTPGEWDFAIELWECRGGIEIYDNIINNGSIDISGDAGVNAVATQKGSYAYSVWIHDNTIGRTNMGIGDGNRGILIEQSAEYVIIERNNNELANKLGNLISRVAALAEKYGIQKCENKLLKKLKSN
mgnify:CR=1 FL=1